MKVETEAGLDYVKLKLHHLRRPMQTKLQQHNHTSVQPTNIFEYILGRNSSFLSMFFSLSQYFLLSGTCKDFNQGVKMIFFTTSHSTATFWLIY